jgi:hypothetical protein
MSHDRVEDFVRKMQIASDILDKHSPLPSGGGGGEGNQLLFFQQNPNPIQIINRLCGEDGLSRGLREQVYPRIIATLKALSMTAVHTDGANQYTIIKTFLMKLLHKKGISQQNYHTTVLDALFPPLEEGESFFCPWDNERSLAKCYLNLLYKNSMVGSALSDLIPQPPGKDKQFYIVRGPMGPEVRKKVLLGDIQQVIETKNNQAEEIVNLKAQIQLHKAKASLETDLVLQSHTKQELYKAKAARENNLLLQHYNLSAQANKELELVQFQLNRVQLETQSSHLAQEEMVARLTVEIRELKTAHKSLVSQLVEMEPIVAKLTLDVEAKTSQVELLQKNLATETEEKSKYKTAFDEIDDELLHIQNNERKNLNMCMESARKFVHWHYGKTKKQTMARFRRDTNMMQKHYAKWTLRRLDKQTGKMTTLFRFIDDTDGRETFSEVINVTAFYKFLSIPYTSQMKCNKTVSITFQYGDLLEKPTVTMNKRAVLCLADNFELIRSYLRNHGGVSSSKRRKFFTDEARLGMRVGGGGGGYTQSK